VGRLNRYDRIAAELLQWGSGSLRDFPWRNTANAWHILVSEVMLQQTSVARVLPKFAAFIEAFPTPGALASAPLGDALQLWSGLGYPRRCRNLREAAIVIHDTHGGDVPSTLEDLLQLPGIGQYTARAVLAFAHHQDVGVVDVNVSRVLSRLEGTPMTARELQTLANNLVPRGLAWEWNQVMMDFGARQCTVRHPECDVCPVRKQCKWRGVGADPAPASAGASKPQATFEGSDRQARGRALRAVGDGVGRFADIADAMHLAHDPKRAQLLTNQLVSEGLLVENQGRFTLP
jgi:A/G-specific adenine glycosylase